MHIFCVDYYESHYGDNCMTYNTDRKWDLAGLARSAVHMTCDFISLTRARRVIIKKQLHRRRETAVFCEQFGPLRLSVAIFYSNILRHMFRCSDSSNSHCDKRRSWLKPLLNRGCCGLTGSRTDGSDCSVLIARFSCSSSIAARGSVQFTIVPRRIVPPILTLESSAHIVSCEYNWSRERINGDPSGSGRSAENGHQVGDLWQLQ